MKFSIMQYAKDCNIPLITTISFYRIYGFFDSLVWENYNIISHLIHSVSYNSHAEKEIELDFIFVFVLSFQKGVDLLPNLHPCILPSSKQRCKILGADFVTRLCPTYPKFSTRILNCSISCNYNEFLFSLKLFTFF